MDIEKVREVALSLPHVSERSPFGPDTLSFEIGGKMFCLLLLSDMPTFYNLKVDPEYAETLRDTYSSVRPGYHMNKKHWISVDFGGDVPDSLQVSLIEQAYALVRDAMPRRLRDLLSDSGGLSTDLSRY